MYKGNEKKVVLASLSNLYSELNTISVDASGLSFCPT